MDTRTSEIREPSAKLRCKTRKKTPNIYGMSVRKLVNELLVISPFVFVLCITVEARTHVDNFVPSQYSDATHQRLVAYVEPVRVVENLLRKGRSEVDMEQARRAAELWRDLSRQGVLLPLPPETPSDSTREGVKGQVRRAADDLASVLQTQSRKAADAGDFKRAAEDAILAIEAVQGLKHSDLHSLGMFSMRQGASMVILRECAARLPAEKKQDLAARLERIRESDRPLTETVLAQQRALHYVPLDEKEKLSRDIRLMVKFASELDEGKAMHSGKEQLSELTAGLKDVNERTLMPDFRFAYNAKRNSLVHFAQLAPLLDSGRA